MLSLVVFILTSLFSTPVNAHHLVNMCHVKAYQYVKTKLATNEGQMKDPEREGITTSEAQGYLLLMAVVMNDQKTFNQVYKWTKTNLQRKDKLFSWLLKKNKDGSYSVIDNNSATDADVNIAFALCLAHIQWDDKKYMDETKPIINSIWYKETKKIGRRRVLMPGVEQNRSQIIEVNPSYFHPYAFKFFKEYDNYHDWNQLVDSSYYYIMESSALTQTKLPPNWFFIENGKIALDPSAKSDFSYDAIRIFKKIYIDYIRTGDERAVPILAKSKFFIPKWKSSKSLYTNYTKDGSLRDLSEFTGSIITLVPAISVFDAKTAAEIFDNKIEPYLTDKNNWGKPKDYYTKSLLWHSCHLYNNKSSHWSAMSEVSKRLKHKEKDKWFNLSFPFTGLGF